MSDPTGAAELDALERRDPAQREAQLMQALPQLVARAQTRRAGRASCRRRRAAIRSRGDLAQLPVTRKSDLKELQTRESPLAA
jgi:phenylacetate-CoA ligase